MKTRVVIQENSSFPRVVQYIILTEGPDIAGNHKPERRGGLFRFHGKNSSSLSFAAARIVRREPEKTKRTRAGEPTFPTPQTALRFDRRDFPVRFLEDLQSFTLHDISFCSHSST